MNERRATLIQTQGHLAAVIGVVGLGLCVLGWAVSPRQFYISYLCAELVWLGITMGCLAFLMIHYLTGGKWGWPLRRIFEAAGKTLPLLALLFVPILLGAKDLYPWAGDWTPGKEETGNPHPMYLQLPFFVLRAAVFFAIWILISHLLAKWSREQDETQDVSPMKRVRKLSGPALVLYPVSITFAYVDWVMSLEKDWFSTMFPILVCIGQMLSGLALVILLLAWVGPRTSLSEILGKEHFHQLGSLLLTFIMLWAYIAFSQLLVIWSGDLPHEIKWYLHRISGSWRWVVSFLFVCHFFGPFFLLLSRQLKQTRLALASVAALILISHVIDVWWMVAPTFFPDGIHLSWLDLAAFAGVGGVWFFIFARGLADKPLIPLNDPRFAVASEL